MKNYLILFTVLIINHSCNKSNSEFKEFESNFTKIEELISNNDKTLLYLTAEWCQAGNNGLNYGLIPFKDKYPEENVIIVYVGSNTTEELNRINQSIEHIYTSTSLINFGYTDKKRIGNILKNFFNYPNHRGGVPILLLLDENKNILSIRHALRLPALEKLYFGDIEEEDIVEKENTETG